MASRNPMSWDGLQDPHVKASRVLVWAPGCMDVGHHENCMSENRVVLAASLAVVIN